MAGSIRGRGALVAAIVATAVVGPLALAAQGGPPAPEVPGDIAVPEGSKLFLVGHAVGVQIYSCIGASWTFVAPRADVYADNGKLIMTHFGGPTWQARDGSSVVAARVNGVTVDPTAIPWLLLRATSTSAGDDGGRLAKTTYIQRINTTGGLAPPASDCSPSTAGEIREVPYTADYFFWKATGKR